MCKIFQLGIWKSGILDANNICVDLISSTPEKWHSLPTSFKIFLMIFDSLSKVRVRLP